MDDDVRRPVMRPALGPDRVRRAVRHDPGHQRKTGRHGLGAHREGEDSKEYREDACGSRHQERRRLVAECLQRLNDHQAAEDEEDVHRRPAMGQRLHEPRRQGRERRRVRYHHIDGEPAAQTVQAVEPFHDRRSMTAPGLTSRQCAVSATARSRLGPIAIVIDEKVTVSSSAARQPSRESAFRAGCVRRRS